MIPELVREHLNAMPTLLDTDEAKEQWWERAEALHQQALDEGYTMEGDPDEDW